MLFSDSVPTRASRKGQNRQQQEIAARLNCSTRQSIFHPDLFARELGDQRFCSPGGSHRCDRVSAIVKAPSPLFAALRQCGHVPPLADHGAPVPTAAVPAAVPAPARSALFPRRDEDFHALDLRLAWTPRRTCDNALLPVAFRAPAHAAHFPCAGSPLREARLLSCFPALRRAFGNIPEESPFPLPWKSRQRYFPVGGRPISWSIF